MWYDMVFIVLSRGLFGNKTGLKGPGCFDRKDLQAVEPGTQDFSAFYLEAK
jgi:hypothetical protein